MGQCCAKPATSVEKRAAPVEQRNDIKRNFSDRQRAWASTGTVALRDADLQVGENAAKHALAPLMPNSTC